MDHYYRESEIKGVKVNIWKKDRGYHHGASGLKDANLKNGSQRSKLCLTWNFLRIEIMTFQFSNQHYLRCVVSDRNGVLGGDVLAAKRITSPVADWPLSV